MPIYKVMETAGAYTAGDEVDIIDPELYATISRTVPLQPVDPIAVDIEDALYGSDGIVTYPAAAAAANGVSIAEVLRYIQETQIGTLANTGGTATLAGILGNPSNVALATSLATILAQLSGAAGIASFPAAAAAADNVSLAEVLRYVQENQLGKIDEAATLGLLGVNNSLAYRVHEIERHLHCYEKWFGVAATPSGTHKADRLGQGILAFEIDGGNLTWGSWVQILGSADTTEKFDLHKIFITDVQETAPYFVQLAFGADANAAVAAGAFTEFVFRVNATNSDRTEIPINDRRQAAGSLGWARCMALGTNTGTMSFYFGMHTYEG